MTFFFKNIPIYYNTFGKGPAIVLLHGFLESSTMWKPLLPQLTANNLVVTIDLPGHGKSGVISEIHTMELMAEVVNEILEHLQITSATFIGHSMGGYVALAYAELFSEKVKKLILLNSTPEADSEERRENRNRALKVIDQNPSAFFSMAIGNLFAEASREKFKTEIEALKTEAYSFPLDGVKAAIKGMRDRKERTAILKNFTKDKHSILADEDPILPLIEAKQLAEQCGVSVKVIEGGHMSLIENVDPVMEYLLFIG
ncbi:alpha/beta fold hydrolase [Aequorivita lipolytica]|uniref:Alpha/beta hydrolase n=1 Tax=Aequorivita lipolytica TaxID=153267 RepID=A0A5C6YSV9_9FLAO|nr:alpha/beta hydrolase [Aequorivita lipolytica]TXD70065.1 alpha/beta hydrolase [Aequorivita lipolytica]SRX50474.1 AB hydrolase superfamily protein YdjP [Aequorivita lipolytica]